MVTTDYREFERGEGVWDVFAASTRIALATFKSNHPKLKLRGIEHIETEKVQQVGVTIVIQSLTLITTDRTR